MDNIEKNISRYDINKDQNLKKLEIIIEEIIDLINTEEDEKNILKLKNHLDNFKKILRDNKENIDIKDNNLFNKYPDKNDDNFLNKLMNKKEFAISKYNKDDFLKINNDFFELSKNQKFIKKFLSPETPYRTLLLFHGVGVGKTCSSIQVSQNFKKKYNKRTLVILPSQLKGNYIKQLFDIAKYNSDNNFIDMKQCLGNYYLNKIVDNQKSSTNKLNINVKKLIEDEYEFLGYQEFANLVKKIKKKYTNPTDFNKKLINYFDDRVIIVDEVHNMRLINTEKQGKDVTKFFQKILSLLQNHVLVLLTATPMFNSYEEIKFIMNLIELSENKKSLFNNLEEDKDKIKIFNNNDNLNKDFIKILKKISNKNISYMRGENPYTFPVRLSPKIYNYSKLLKKNKYPNKDIFNQSIPDNEQIKYLDLVKTKLTSLQHSIYSNIKSNNNNEDSTDFQQKIQISNFIYPSLSVFDFNEGNIEVKDDYDVKDCYGEKGFNKIFKKDESKFSFKYRDNILNSFGEILNYNNISFFSNKMKLLIDNAINSDGKVLIYSRYLYSGIIPICMCLEHLGINNTDDNILNKSNLEKKTDNSSLKNILEKTKNMGSYIVISGNNSLSKNKLKNIDKFNSKDNTNGEKIKFILITESGSEGIDLKGVRQTHIFDPWFNVNRLEQIYGRSVRNFSHFDLEEKKRNCLIFNYVNMNIDELKDIETIDFRMYRISENKQTKISMIERIIKENSVDCKLNEDILSFKNIKKTIQIPDTRLNKRIIENFDISDKNNSKICDYMDCNIKCNINLEKDELDEKTFNKNILENDIKTLQEHIKLFYFKNSKNHFKLEEIEKNLEEVIIDEKILFYALEDLVKNKTLFQRKELNVNKDTVNSKNKNITEKKRIGFLIKKGNEYIFQPNDIDDEKILLNEKKDSKKIMPNSLNITSLNDLVKENVNDSLSTKKMSEKEIENKLKQKSVELVEKLKKSYDTLDKFLKIIFINKSNDFKEKENKSYVQIIWDIVIDNLNERDLLKLYLFVAKNILNKKISKNIIKSLNKVKLISYDENDNMEAFYNYYSDIFVCLENNKLEECAPLKNNELKNNYTKYIKELKKSDINVLGFVDILKNNNISFKIVDLNKKKEKKSVRGTDCIRTSTIKINILKDYINNIDKKLLNDNVYYKKENLCLIYQYLLRRMNSNNDIFYLRPCLVKYLII